MPRPQGCLRLMTRTRCVEAFRGLPIEALKWMARSVANAAAAPGGNHVSPVHRRDCSPATALP